MEQFSYYMVRVRHSSTESRAESLAGVVERLGSGEKQRFADGEELLRLLSGWIDGLYNMGRAAGRGKY